MKSRVVALTLTKIDEKTALLDESKIKLSVIIPVYNSETSIIECVKSIQNSQIDSMEIILIDDGSTDNSYEKCIELSNSNPNIACFSKINGGSASARNYGLERARGEYINFIDSDDYVDSEEYKNTFLYVYELNVDIGCFGMNSEENGKITALLKAGESIWHLFINNPIYMHSVCNKFFRKSILNEVYFVEDLVVCEDMLFCGQAFLKAKKTTFVDKYIYNYRKKENSVTHVTSSEKKSQDDINAANKLFYYSQRSSYDHKEIEQLIAFRYQIAGLRYLTEPEIFSIEKYHSCVLDKNAYRNFKILRHRVLCWCANHRINIVPKIFIHLKKVMLSRKS